MDTTKIVYRKLFVLGFLIVILLSFLFLIRDLLITVILAATFSGLLYPAKKRVERWLKGRSLAASVIVLSAALLIIGIPLLAILVVAANEALQVSDSVRPWLQEQISKPTEHWRQSLEWIPFYDNLVPYQSKIMEGLTQMVKLIGTHMTRFFSAATLGTVGFIFKLFVALYSAFFFLSDGEGIIKTIQNYLPLTTRESVQMTEKGLAIIRATIKSIFVIGLIQGVLIWPAFTVLGIKGAVFWSLMVAVFSAVPGLGAPMIWIPAVIYLFITERILGAVGLMAWGTLVVGMADNFLRPVIIGRDTEVPELMILLSILGGLATFGIPGLIFGPVLVSLLVSALEIYARVYDKALSND